MANKYFIYNLTIDFVYGPYSFRDAWNLKKLYYDNNGDKSIILKMVVDWKGNLVKDDKEV